MIKAEIICDSKNEFGDRITTFILTFPRYLLAEINTHRMLSRNSASSRAIRFEKMVKSVMENPFIPYRWQKDHAGMQGTEYFTDDEVKQFKLVEDHLEARNNAIMWARRQNSKGVTKQLCNRLIEPFMYHTCLLTGTEFENFFALRAHDAAEIHFGILAEEMLKALNESEPKQLNAGEWHIPFGDTFDWEMLSSIAKDRLGWPESIPPRGLNNKNLWDETIQKLKIELATFRCAQISYITHENEMPYIEMLAKHDRLVAQGHMSAFEHCARAMNEEECEQFTLVVPRRGWPKNPQKYLTKTILKGVCGNFRGFIQYRKMFPNENRSDSRLIKK